MSKTRRTLAALSFAALIAVGVFPPYRYADSVDAGYSPIWNPPKLYHGGHNARIDVNRLVVQAAVLSVMLGACLRRKA